MPGSLAWRVTSGVAGSDVDGRRRNSPQNVSQPASVLDVVRGERSTGIG